MNPVRTFFGRWWAILATVVAWQLVVTVFQVNQYLIPGPIPIVGAIVADPLGYLLPALLTLLTAAIGFVVGVALGYVLASLAWLVPVIGTLITPLALIVRSVPAVAFVPVLALLLGYSATTAWVICAVACFFPTFVLVGSGLADAPAHGVDLFTVNGATRWSRYRHLAVPSSLPALVTSMRISVTVAFGAALFSQFVMGSPGLASVLIDALARLDMLKLWGTATCAIIIGVSGYLLASRLETYAIARLR